MPRAKRAPDDKRTTRRVKVALRALVTDLESGRRYRCFVRDATAEGCKLVANFGRFLPERIRIRIDGLEAPFDAKVLWRTARMAGVKFLREAPDDGSAPEPRTESTA